ncbi:MAG TPA: hypothetical protein VGX16_08110, partial [Solirubrobacteraceae bacterium]|nr:hypothetical protein [Solirubrobacteraceae bacterium]
MSWPLASFLLVGVVLAAGWLAYERSRPSARMVAVVATLAAAAALGRDAFVALPDVKPITAMALVVGYALGPLPGFTVGAVGMLASNIVLGQGPYTPWQMAAWGLVGLFGAVLGRLSHRRMGRVSLALACALAALAAKEIMNLYTWTLGASHTPAALLAVVSVALPFDLVDVVASFLFGLAFAPELARLLGRMRERMEVRWEAAAVSVLAVLLAIVLVAGLFSSGPSAQALPTRDASTARASLTREVSFLVRAQNRDGGFGGARGQPTSELYSAWAAMGLAAAGRNPGGVVRDGHTVLRALRREASSVRSAGDIERTILALHAMWLPPRALDGRDLVGELLRARVPGGSFERLVNITSFAVFALRAAGPPGADSVVRAAGSWLAREQNRDGGFGFAGRGGPS